MRTLSVEQNGEGLSGFEEKYYELLYKKCIEMVRWNWIFEKNTVGNNGKAGSIKWILL